MDMRMPMRLPFGLLLLLGSMGPAAGKEDAVPCHCWYGGYDDCTQDQGGRSFCDDPPPGTTMDECELIHTPQTPAKEWWTDGCSTAADGGARLCPYKS